MESTFLIIVVIMFILAIADLIVGVSNDAVNFLNSAIGSNASSFRSIMIIASIGIILGSVFSGGMMEVARKGVFNPQFFTFSEIMFLFAAVMLTDIILLDFYNSIALPTSTTVSIVFELLGAGIAVSYFSVLGKDGSIGDWSDYINGSRALVIVMGIFISVFVAFLIGWLVQYLARLITTFDYHRSINRFGAIFGALSVSLISAFILNKGLKGLPFVNEDFLMVIKSNSLNISIVTFLLSFVVFQVIGRIKKDFNVYRFVTLLGTFALAMAFASNDLVNFIGVPIASYDSWIHWKASGLGANEFMMEDLAKPVRSNILFLFGAGVIMTITLWYSKKARSVVQTSVNLGRQEEGNERFEANILSRSVVKGSLFMAEVANRVLPESSIRWIRKRFEGADSQTQTEAAAFDLVRSSVNLIVAAAIILLATSYKLPLSTTFVSFMVLMGTSLADRAWGKGSAVYRVSGVLIVIGGWFLTAAIAMLVSMLFASLLVNFEIYALIVLVVAAILLIFKNFFFYRHNRYKSEVNLEMADKWFRSDFLQVENEVREKLSYILTQFEEGYRATLNAMIHSDLVELNRLLVISRDVESTNDLYKVKLTQQIRNVPEEYRQGGKVLMLVYDLEDDLLYSLINIVTACQRHVINLHPTLQSEQLELLERTRKEIRDYVGKILSRLDQDVITQDDFNEFKKARKKIIRHIEEGISSQITLATKRKLSGKNSELMLTILLSSKNIVLYCSRLVKIFHKVKSEDTEDLLDKLMED